MLQLADPGTASIKGGFGSDQIRKIKHNSGDVRAVYFLFCPPPHGGGMAKICIIVGWGKNMMIYEEKRKYKG